MGRKATGLLKDSRATFVRGNSAFYFEKNITPEKEKSHEHK